MGPIFRKSLNEDQFGLLDHNEYIYMDWWDLNIDQHSNTWIWVPDLVPAVFLFSLPPFFGLTLETHTDSFMCCYNDNKCVQNWKDWKTTNMDEKNVEILCFLWTYLERMKILRSVNTNVSPRTLKMLLFFFRFWQIKRVEEKDPYIKSL